MIVFDRSGRHDAYAWRSVGLFGLGTVGRAIQDAIEPDLTMVPSVLPFDWSNASMRTGQSEAIAAEFQRRASQRGGAGRVDLIWAAGRAGMMTTSAETPSELAAFKDFIGIGDILLARFTDLTLTYHVVSSAGALFEGQRWVGRDTQPQPRLPYGILKFDQERLLTGVTPRAGAIAYRPSSVYGYSGPGTRLGLIPVLIKNTYDGKMSFIFARADSIRDYVLAADVGKFIATQLDCPPQTRASYVLASGRPAAIFEIARRIEHILRRKSYLRFATQHANASDNSYLPSALPAGWHPTPLDSGLRLTARRILGIQQPVRFGGGLAEMMAH